MLEIILQRHGSNVAEGIHLLIFLKCRSTAWLCTCMMFAVAAWTIVDVWHLDFRTLRCDAVHFLLTKIMHVRETLRLVSSLEL